MDNEDAPQEYASYNGMSRVPMIAGIPFMPALMVFSIFVMGGIALQMKYGIVGLLAVTPAIPILIFFRIISENDDRAINILLLQAKWVLIKTFFSNAAFFGGTFTILPIKYGRRLSEIKRSFKEANSW